MMMTVFTLKPLSRVISHRIFSIFSVSFSGFLFLSILNMWNNLKDLIKTSIATFSKNYKYLEVLKTSSLLKDYL